MEGDPGPRGTLPTDPAFQAKGPRCNHREAACTHWTHLAQLRLLAYPHPRADPPHGRPMPVGDRGRGAYLVHVEIEEDASSHLGNEDQEEEDEVLGTQSRPVS